jgi:hypothetical protein
MSFMALFGRDRSGRRCPLIGAKRTRSWRAPMSQNDPERTWATSKDISASARLSAIYGQLTHVMRYAPVRAILGCRSPLYLRRLPSIAAAEHALLECSGIGKTSNVTGLTIAKIERGLGDRGAARVPVRSDDISVNLIYNLVGARSSGACQQND